MYMLNENEIILERSWILHFYFMKLQIFYPLKALNITHFSLLTSHGMRHSIKHYVC